MLIGAHCVINSPKPEADLAFFRDVLKLPSIDDGGYVIFGLPPAEVSVHQSEGNGHALFLMCDDIHAFLTEMQKRKIDCGPAQDQGWGVLTEVTLPSGGSSTFTSRGTSVRNRRDLPLHLALERVSTSPTATGWSVPVHDDHVLFEFLIIEGAQAGSQRVRMRDSDEGQRSDPRRAQPFAETPAHGSSARSLRA